MVLDYLGRFNFTIVWVFKGKEEEKEKGCREEEMVEGKLERY